MMPWATINDWRNIGREVLGDIILPTHFRGVEPTSTIDHILTSGSDQIEVMGC